MFQNDQYNVSIQCVIIHRSLTQCPFIRFSPDLCPIGTDSLPIHFRTARPRIKCIYSIRNAGSVIREIYEEKP